MHNAKNNQGLVARLGDAIDRVIRAISPRWGYERLAWRSGLSGYDSGGFDGDGWLAINQHGAIEDRNSRNNLRAFSRDLERNSDIAESLILTNVRNVVGLGFNLQSHITKADGTEDDELNTLVESLWKEHGTFRNFDVAGRQSRAEQLRMGVRRLGVDGGILFVKSFTNTKIPIQWQMREVDDLDSTKITTPGSDTYIVDGIEFDKYGKRVAYWFRNVSPDGFQQLEPERITADRVIFLEHFKRPSQPREITPLSPAIQRIRGADGYVQDVTKQARVSSRFGIFIKQFVPNGQWGRPSNPLDPKSGMDRKEIPSGLIIQGQPGDEIQAINPPQLGSSPKDLTAIHQRLTAASQGLSYEAASRDYSQVNFASGRLGQDGDIDTYRMLQQYIIEHALDEMYSSFIIAIALKGLVPFTVSDVLSNRERFLKHEFMGRGWPWSQPVQETNANKTALETGQKTLMEIHAGKGGDYKEAIAQRKREIELLRDAGLMPGSAVADGGGSNAAKASE